MHVSLGEPISNKVGSTRLKDPVVIKGGKTLRHGKGEGIITTWGAKQRPPLFSSRVSWFRN